MVTGLTLNQHGNNNNNNNDNSDNNIANITKTLQKSALLEQQTLNALMAGRPLGGGSTSLRSTRAELKREMSAASEELERGLGFDRSAKRRRKTKHVERNSFYPSSYFEWTEELMVSKDGSYHRRPSSLTTQETTHLSIYVRTAISIW